MFDKPSGWTYQDWLWSEACQILNEIPNNVPTWVDARDMSDQEKADHPEHATTGGYLKELDEKGIAQDYWNTLTDAQKKVIFSLPNFDKDKFFLCTGIRVDEEEDDKK